MISAGLNNPLVRRAAFVGLHTAILIALFVLVLLPIREMLADRENEIVRLSDTLARLKGISQHKPETLSPGETSLRAEAFLLGPNEGVATANLQARLKMLSEGVGAKLRSVQGLQARNEGQLRYIGARLEIFGALPAIHQAIHAIEDAKPFVTIPNSTLKLSPEIALPGNASEPVLDAQLDVLGAYQSESAP